MKNKIFPELEQGRPGWDKPHTECVVSYVKKIVRNAPHLKLDLDSLIIVGYSHDWGYAKLFKNGLYVGGKEIQKVKSLHAQISAKKISSLLKNSIFDFLKPEQKERIRHLVLNHDNLEKLIHNDELVFMEADTLGQLDINRVVPTFNKTDGEKYMEKVEQTRIPKFITQFSKKRAEKLLKLRKEYHKIPPR
ncbi:MAG: hypothetical protein HYT62_00170 [Candidatus Yanofskybacteria bacterium]|nr:hypothetical protein [Candidatus Yanofskybacteria bacterium]